MVPVPNSESQNWTPIGAMRQQVHDAGMAPAGLMFMQPSATDMSQQQLGILVGQEQAIWLPSSEAVWFPTAGVGSDDHPGTGNQRTYVNGTACMDTVTWEQGRALGSEHVQHSPEFPSWQRTWNPLAEAAPHPTSFPSCHGNLALDRVGVMSAVPAARPTMQVLSEGPQFADSACSCSEPSLLQDLSLLDEHQEDFAEELLPGLLQAYDEHQEDEEDFEEAELANVAVKSRRHQRRHRAGRRRQRAVVNRTERRQRIPPTLALVGPHGRRQEAPAAIASVEIQQGRDDLAVRCLEQLESGVEKSRCAAIAALRGQVLALSFQALGCRVVQLAFDSAGRSDIEAMAAELHGHVRDAITSPHANYVVQKAVEVLPPAKAGFVPEELLGVAVLTASHKYGCRIISRIVEHPGSDHSHALIAELLVEAEELCRSVYGRNVICSIMEHGLVQQRKRVVTALRSLGVAYAAKSRHASYILEKALDFADEEDHGALVAELLDDPETLLTLAESQVGCYVVKALIRNPGKYSETTFAYLNQAAQRLKATKYGRHLLEELML